MNFSSEEKTLILGALFHDIGKFQQRCEDIRRDHEELGASLLDELKDLFIPIFNGDEKSFAEVKNIILNHHLETKSKLTQIVRTADHLSASERIKKEEPEPGTSQWEHKLLASIFSKLRINSKNMVEPLFFNQDYFIEGNYAGLIPNVTENNAKSRKDFGYSLNTFSEFNKDLQQILIFYTRTNDFNTLINLLIVLFEKYLWCVPDFTGNKQTDISLFNHSKDVAGISHALYLAGDDNKHLNLIIGDIPGIQKYIFDITNQRPAKILRGRSIFVQILARQLATKWLRSFGLIDLNLIMLAGGKFYIIAPNYLDFESRFLTTLKNVEQELIKEFNYEIKFTAGFHRFSHEDLKNKVISFGEIVSNATKSLEENRYKLWKQVYNFSKFDESKTVFPIGFIEGENEDKMKCRVTDRPILFDKAAYLPRYAEEGDESDILVNKQVKLEHEIGRKIPKENSFFIFNQENEDRIYSLKELIKSKKHKVEKLLINARLKPLLAEKNIEYLENTTFLEVASFVSQDDKKNVIPFDMIAEKSEGAKFLTLIKGDIDNLGIIMAHGLAGIDKETDFTSISRTTTMSNQLRYFFSFYLNGFLEEYAKKNNTFIYIVFAGGDDLMLITPHSEALKLLDELNMQFEKFVCFNPELHLSYSLTNFKHGTPIRVVSEFAEDNQSNIKREFKATRNNIPDVLKNVNSFFAENDKAGTRIFDSSIKNSKINELLETIRMLERWIEPKDKNVKPKLTHGMLRNLMVLSEIMKNYREKGETKDLLWHPKLTYQVNRLLKKNGKYINNDVGEFFEKILKINKNEEEKEFEKLLYPAVCTAIYLIRN